MTKNRALLFKVATIALAVSFFIQVLTVIGMVFLRVFLTKMGILHAAFEVHEYNGFIFTALILPHVWLNWGWVRANILKTN